MYGPHIIDNLNLFIIMYEPHIIDSLKFIYK